MDYREENDIDEVLRSIRVIREFSLREEVEWLLDSLLEKGKKRKKKSLSLSSFLLERKMDTVVHAKNLISNLSI